jgi:hypothetical protein
MRISLKGLAARDYQTHFLRLSGMKQAPKSYTPAKVYSPRQVE